MRKIWAIAKKEIIAVWGNPTGYIFAAILLLVVNAIFFNDLFLSRVADMQLYWRLMTYLLSLFVPAIAMGLIAEEKKSGTWEVLLALPVKEGQMVVGKFMGYALFTLASISLSVTAIVTVLWLGRPDVGLVIGGFWGTVLLAWSYLAIGIFMSSLTTQPIIAFIATTIVLLVNNFMAQDIFTSRLPEAVGRFAGELSLAARSANLSQGLVEVKDITFFVSWIAIFLILTSLNLKARNK